MHTPLEFYVVLPRDLFRRGQPNRARLDYIRSMPPRTPDQAWDVRVYDRSGVTFVDAKSGGLSLFNVPIFATGEHWWCVPTGTRLPDGLHVSLDAGKNKRFVHFTVRPLYDMPLDRFLELLRELEKSAVRCAPPESKREVG